MLKFVGRFFTFGSSWTRMRPCPLSVTKQFGTQRFDWRQFQWVVYNWTCFHFRRFAPYNPHCQMWSLQLEETLRSVQKYYLSVIYVSNYKRTKFWLIIHHITKQHLSSLFEYIFHAMICDSLHFCTCSHLLCEKSIKLHHFCLSGPISLRV